MRLKNFNPEKRMMMRVIDHASSSTSCISHRVADMMRSLQWYVTADLSSDQPLDACGSVQLMFAIPSSVVALVVRGAQNFWDSAGPGRGWTLGRPWGNFGPTAGRLSADFWLTLIYFGATLS